MKSVDIIVCLFEYIKKKMKWFFNLTHMNISFVFVDISTDINYRKPFSFYYKNSLFFFLNCVSNVFTVSNRFLHRKLCSDIYVWRLFITQGESCSEVRGMCVKGIIFLLYKKTFTYYYSRRWEHLLEYRGDILVRLGMNAKVMIVIIYGYGPFEIQRI